ncbi:MAG: response regulator [Candidatus Promineifilaceae bacterium]|nr:response regulator [Candidatus Promineifilaceae bacterium]
MTNYAEIDYGIKASSAGGRQRKQAGRVDGAVPAGTSSPMGRLVLLIDDTPAVAKAVGRVLREIGFDSVIAGNGRDGLAVYQERREEIELVILDMNMPVMNGEETLKALRNFDPEVKVLIATTADEGEVRRRCAEQGQTVPHYLRKTDGVAMLIEKVQAALGEENND